jgi:hypothetical protein
VKKLLLAACMALGLVACGGGGGASPDLASSAASSADVLKAKPVVPDPTLQAQPLSMVNTTTAGDQVFRSIGALSDGGYTVAWISENSTLFIQRYDSAGNKVGGETTVPIIITSTDSCFTFHCDPALAIRDASIAALADGSVVVSYNIDRPAGQDNLGFPQANLGIFIQRFDANGVQLAGETAVFTQLASSNRNHPSLLGPQVVPLADGGFVVAWGSATGSDAGLFSSFGKQRYDSQSVRL